MLRYDPTVEDSYRRQITVEGSAWIIDLLDTAGQEEYSAMRSQYIRTGQIFFLVYGANYDSDQVPNFIEEIAKVKDHTEEAMGPFVILIGNKIDLESEMQVTEQKHICYHKQFHCAMSYRLSAKTRDCWAFSGNNPVPRKCDLEDIFRYITQGPK